MRVHLENTLIVLRAHDLWLLALFFYKNHVYKKKIENSFDLLRGREKESEDKSFHFSFANARKVGLSPVPNMARSEIHTIATYDRETHFDVNTNKLDDRESSSKVNTFETQNWKQNFLDILVRFFHCS